MTNTESKRALLFGINYVACHDSSVRLHGCCNDCDLIKNVLLKKGFAEDKILVAKDEESLSKTSKEGILDELYTLMNLTWKENLKEVVLHFSGHGKMFNRSMGNMDMEINTIIPWDFQKSGVIPDNKIHRILAQANPDTKIICIFDCCHSGEMVNLPHKYFKSSEMTDGSYASEDTQNHMYRRQPKIQGEIITISACKNEQTAAGSFNLRNEGEHSGVLSTYLSKVFRENAYGQISLSTLLESLQSYVKARGFHQETVVCANEELGGDSILF